MNIERKDFLSVIQMPARAVAEEAAWLLGFAPHDIPVLVNAGLLKPLGHPPASGTKFFATATLLKLREDLNWAGTRFGRHCPALAGQERAQGA